MVRRVIGDLLHYRSRDAGAVVLRRASRNSVVADHWVREGEDLPGIRRIGQRFFVPGHTGIEDRFAERSPFESEPVTLETAAVGEKECRRLPTVRHAANSAARYRVSPPTIVASTLRGSRLPANGVHLPLDANVAGSTFQGRSAKIVTSAGLPIAKLPASSERMRAGFVESSSTNRISDRPGSAAA